MKFETPNDDDQGEQAAQKPSPRLELAASDIADCGPECTILLTAPSQFENVVQTVLRKYKLAPAQD